MRSGEERRLAPALPDRKRAALRRLVGQAQKQGGRRGDFWSRYGMPMAFLFIVGVFVTQSDDFLTLSNSQNIVRQSAVIAIAAIGVSALFISGGIDISQGPIIAFSGLATITLINLGVTDYVAIPIAIGMGAVFGGANAFFAERVKIPALIATLGTALVIRGSAFLWTGGRSIALEREAGAVLKWLGRGLLLFIPAPFLVTLVVAAAVATGLRFTTWGRHTYAIGGNQEAARTVGINIERRRTTVYILAGSLSALAGVVLAGRLASAAPNAATGAEFDIITASVLGGVSIFGGEGRVWRVLLAAILLASLSNGLVQLNVPGFWVRIVTGVVFLAALSLDRIQSTRS